MKILNLFILMLSISSLVRANDYLDNYNKISQAHLLTQVEKIELNGTDVSFGIIEQNDEWFISSAQSENNSPEGIHSKHQLNIEFVDHRSVNRYINRGQSREEAINQVCNKSFSVLESYHFIKNDFKMSFAIPDISINGINFAEIQNLKSFQVSDFSIVFEDTDAASDLNNEESFSTLINDALKNSNVLLGGVFELPFKGYDRIACALFQGKANIVLSYTGEYESVDYKFQGLYDKNEFIEVFNTASDFVARAPEDLRDEFGSIALTRINNLFENNIESLDTDFRRETVARKIDELAEVIRVWKEFNREDNTYPAEAFYYYFGETYSYRQHFAFNLNFTSNN